MASANVADTLSAMELSERAAADGSADCEDDVVDPWNVVSKSQTGIDYDKLISK
jgi:hypothetical protein